MLLRKLKQALGNSSKTNKGSRELEVSLKDINDVLKEENEIQLSNLDEKSQEHLKKIRKKIEEMQEELKKLKEVEHPDRIQMLEDVKDNFCRKRLRMTNDLKVPDNVRTNTLDNFRQQLSRTLDQLSETTEKEQFALDKFEESSSTWDRLQELKESYQAFKGFLKEDYSLKLDLDWVEDKVDQIEELKRKNNSIRQQIDDLKREKGEKEEEIQAAEEDYEQYKEDEKHKEIEQLEEQKEELKRRTKRKEKKVDKELSRVDRTLRKFKYKVDNKGVKLSREERNVLQLLLADRELATVLDKLESKERGLTQLFESLNSEADKLNISNKKRDNLSQLVNNIKDNLITPLRKRKEVKANLKELKSELKGYSDFLAKEETYQKRIERLQDERDRIESRIERKIEDKRDAIADNQQAIESSKRSISDKIEESELNPDTIVLEGDCGQS